MSALFESLPVPLEEQTAGSGFIPLPAPGKSEQSTPPGQPRLVKGRDMRG